jgi:formate dehydrogenase maturation protein FdhE
MSKKSDEIYEQAVKIVTAIKQKLGVDNDYVPVEDVEGSMLCPLCGKEEMTYFISSYNGHRHAHCGCFGTYCE